MAQFANPSTTISSGPQSWDRRSRRGVCPHRRQFQPRVDLMEDRTLLSPLLVTNNNDSGTGSLRAEIASATNGDTIKFANSLKHRTGKTEAKPRRQTRLDSN